MSDAARMPTSYDADISREQEPDYSGLCEMDGYTEDADSGDEHYWSCGKEAVTTIRVVQQNDEPYILRVCVEHAEEPQDAFNNWLDSYTDANGAPYAQGNELRDCWMAAWAAALEFM